MAAAPRTALDYANDPRFLGMDDNGVPILAGVTYDMGGPAPNLEPATPGQPTDSAGNPIQRVIKGPDGGVWEGLGQTVEGGWQPDPDMAARENIPKGQQYSENGVTYVPQSVAQQLGAKYGGANVLDKVAAATPMLLGGELIAGGGLVGDLFGTGAPASQTALSGGAPIYTTSGGLTYGGLPEGGGQFLNVSTLSNGASTLPGAVTSAADPVALMDALTQAVPGATVNEAAQTLGFNSFQELAGTVNPAWVGPAAAAAGVATPSGSNSGPSNPAKPLGFKDLLSVLSPLSSIISAASGIKASKGLAAPAITVGGALSNAPGVLNVPTPAEMPTAPSSTLQGSPAMKSIERTIARQALSRRGRSSTILTAERLGA